MRVQLAAGKPVQVIDVRPRAAVSRLQDIAEGVQWRDPEQLQQWMDELSRSEPVVVYCVRFSCRLQDRDQVARGGLRCEVHDQRTLRLEGDRRANQNERLRRPS